MFALILIWFVCLLARFFCLVLQLPSFSLDIGRLRVGGRLSRTQTVAVTWLPPGRALNTKYCLDLFLSFVPQKVLALQGSGGAYEVSQRFTAMVGWAATSGVDNFVFDQAAERYALDEDVAKQLQESNPEAFKNIVSRLLEAAGRGMWSADEKTLDKLRELYSDADDLNEEGSVVL